MDWIIENWIFKNECDVQSCSNYTGIKLMSRTMTMCERVVEYFGEKVRKMKLGWFGNVQRRDSGYIG